MFDNFLSVIYRYLFVFFLFFFFNDTATTEIYTLSLHDALPISDTGTRHSCPSRSRQANSTAASIWVRRLYSEAVGLAMRKRSSSRRAGSRPRRYGFSPCTAALALSPPPPSSPRPTRPLSVSTSTMVRTKRPQ